MGAELPKTHWYQRYRVERRLCLALKHVPEDRSQKVALTGSVILEVWDLGR